MKIGFFIRSLTNGGAERVAAQLAEIWTTLGHEIVLLTEFPSSEGEFPCSYAAREYVQRDKLNTDYIQSLHRKYGFRVLVFNDAINDNWFPPVFTATTGMESVKTIIINHHTADNWFYTLGCTKEFDRASLLAQADAMVCVEAIEALWWHHRGVKSFYVPNPVSISQVSDRNERRNRKFGRKELLWVGRIEDFAKRPDMMIRAFVKIHKAYPAVHLSMIGTCTSGTRRRLLKDVPEDVCSAIEFVGFTNRVSDYMDRADINIFTSLTEVTVSQVILEAQAHGLPTVALDMPALRSLGKHDAQGRTDAGVVTASDEEMLVKQVLTLLLNEELLDEVSLEAFKAAKEKRETNEVSCLWEKLLDAIDDGVALDAFRKSCISSIATPSRYDDLLFSIYRAEHYFIKKYLPELRKFKMIKNRLSPAYLFRRMKSKFFQIGK